MDDKLLNDIKIICKRVKDGESEPSRINSGLRKGCYVSLAVYTDGVIKSENGIGRTSEIFIGERIA